MSQTVLVTGANRGLGLALATLYHELGHYVIAVCRESSEALDHVANNVITGVDMGISADLDRVVNALSGRDIDILINNAGMWHDDKLGQFDMAKLSEQMQVNAFGPFQLIESLLGHLAEGAKVVNVTSRMGSIGDNDSGGRYGYRASKAALNAMTKSLAIDLRPKGIAVMVIHPGLVNTRMVGFKGSVSPEDAAKSIAKQIALLSVETTGCFLHAANGEPLPW